MAEQLIIMDRNHWRFPACAGIDREPRAVLTLSGGLVLVDRVVPDDGLAQRSLCRSRLWELSAFETRA